MEFGVSQIINRSYTSEKTLILYTEQNMFTYMCVCVCVCGGGGGGVMGIFIEERTFFLKCIQLFVIISNLIVTITMLIKCIQSLHRRPSFGIAIILS